MAYSLVGILAIVIHLIINIGVFIDMKRGRKFRGEKFYFFFLLTAILFHLADVFWGIFFFMSPNPVALRVSTTLYMLALASSILLWAFFVSKYLDLNKKESGIILIINIAIFAFQAITVLINIFYPIVFLVTESCEYSAQPIRYVNLALQISIYLLMSTYTLISVRNQSGSEKRKYLTIVLFGLFMIAAITAQVFLPELPVYSMGYLFGICILHTFVVRDVLEDREEQIHETKQQIKIDPLTGALSKYAYQETWEEIETLIANNELKQLALVMFDLNDLKLTNDTYGHEIGDKYLVDSFNLIKEFYHDIPLYRVGGDEFVALFINGQYPDRLKYFSAFNKRIDENVKNKDRLIISSGIAEYDSDKDSSVLTVFTRADRDMYMRKQKIKKAQQKV